MNSQLRKEIMLDFCFRLAHFFLYAQQMCMMLLCNLLGEVSPHWIHYLTKDWKLKIPDDIFCKRMGLHHCFPFCSLSSKLSFRLMFQERHWLFLQYNKLNDIRNRKISTTCIQHEYDQPWPCQVASALPMGPRWIILYCINYTMSICFYCPISKYIIIIIFIIIQSYS